MNPYLVKSPKNKVNEIYKVFPEKYFSLAVLKYGEQTRIGIRWDGEDNELGYPHSYGYPTWFILPKNVGIYYAKQLGNNDMLEMFIKTTDEPLL